MNKMIKTIIILAIVMTRLVISGCTDSEPAPQQQFNHNLPVVPVAVDVTIGEALADPYAYETIRVTGIVNQTIDVTGYTYIEIILTALTALTALAACGWQAIRHNWITAQR